MKKVKIVKNADDNNVLEGDMSFEQALARLEEIVTALEERELSLDESLALYEEGVKLAAICNRILDNAATKIKILGESGEEEDFKAAGLSREDVG